jgi:16S rRNA A1518/A1519 N6-dimethyltransferase RsmA/KsgA/DIM1 with predicted DNA glycosylase/AP lyase activity
MLECVFNLSVVGKVFVPPPKVHAAVIHLEPLKAPLIDQPFPVVQKVTAAIFHYRQKHIRRGAK